MAGNGVSTPQPRPWSALAQFGLQSALLALGLALVLTLQLLPSRYHFNEGDVVTFNVKSPYKVSYASQLATKTEREKAAAAVAEVVEVDPGIANQQARKLDDLLQRIGDIRRQGIATDQKLRALNAIAGLNLGSMAAREALIVDESQWILASQETRHVLGLAMSERFGEAQLPEVLRRLPALVNAQYAPDRRALVAELAAGLVRPTVQPNPEATAAAREAARAAVKPVVVSVEKGETILRDGDVVKALDIEKLEAVGLASPSLNWNDVVGNALLAAVVAVMLAAYLFFFQPSTWANTRRLMLVYAVVLVGLLAAKLTVPGRELLAYAFPAAAVPMLLATLLDVHLAMVTAALLAPVFGLVVGGSLELTAAALVGGFAGLLGVWRMERQAQAVFAGLGVGVATFFVVLSFKLWSQDAEPGQILFIGGLCMVNGVLSTIVTLGTSSMLGHLFGVTTTPGLLELAHPSQPLFRRLLTQAPGTYHHSVVVANLAERAAQQIGADSLLTRVGAYYHDIGKVARPYCFVENQFEGQNIHDKLNPQMSAKLVSAHVKDGLQMARQHGLPSKVRDIIEQHHGTKLAKYFYQRACRDGCEGGTVEDDFRYAGPRPQSKEAALVMLADAVEATVRSLDDHSAEGIARTVTRIVNETMIEGQLNECDLSLRDLQTIKEAFASVLQGIYHPRVKYPEVEDAAEVVGTEALAVGTGTTNAGAGPPPLPVGQPAGPMPGAGPT